MPRSYYEKETLPKLVRPQPPVRLSRDRVKREREHAEVDQRRIQLLLGVADRLDLIAAETPITDHNFSLIARQTRAIREAIELLGGPRA